MVVIYTHAYNAEKTLPRTIQSVLDQTEQDWVWYLVDNAATDATGEIIRQSAARDPRIIPLANEHNHVFRGTWWWDVIQKHSESDWFCWQDADDTLSPTFLTEMLAFVRAQSLDAAACAYDAFNALTGEVSWRRTLPQDLILARPQDFESYFPIYHQFMRTYWAKLFSIALLRRCDWERIPPVSYGLDTLITQEMFRLSGRFGILAKSLHQYYVSPKSVSYRWDPGRFEADCTLYRCACSYLLDKCGTISERNRRFLQAVYANAINDTTGVIQNAALSPADRLREYRAIASCPVTLAAYRTCTDEGAERSRTNLLVRALESGAALGKQDDTDLRAVMQTLLPRCGRVVSSANARLFLEDRRFLQSLLRDDPDALMSMLLQQLQDQKNVKKYAVPEAIHALAADKPLLCQIGDTAFLRKYAGIYWMVWQGNTLQALEEMTGLLIEDQVDGGKEPFLQLYISLAAVEEQVPAFAFGKLQLAKLYLRQDRNSESRAIVSDLTEMGLDNEELSQLRQKLGETS